MEFSKRLDLFGDEIFAALNERKVALEAQGRTIYNLSVGTPDFAPAEHIRKAMMDAAADPQNWKYSLRDLPELLDAVCGYYKRRFGVEITPDQVASCAGSQEGVGHIGMVLCDEGDTVLLPTPCYPVFIAGSLLGRRKAVVLPADQGARLPALCEGHPGGCGPQGKVHDRLPARKPGGQRGHAGAVRRAGGLCKEVRHSHYPRQRLQRHHL